MAATILLLLGLAFSAQDKPVEPFQVRFVHEGDCGAFDQDQRCRTDKHWKIRAADRPVGGLADLGALTGSGLRKPAGRSGAS